MLQHHPHASFEVLWPLEVPLEEHPPVSNAPPLPPTVVVVEDDPAILQLVRLRLGREDVRLHSYSSWSEARAWLRTGVRADLLLTDLSPLGDDPWTELDAVTGALSGPIVLMTGRVEIPDNVSEGLVTHVVRKPFEIDEVVQQVMQILHDSEATITPTVQT